LSPHDRCLSLASSRAGSAPPHLGTGEQRWVASLPHLTTAGLSVPLLPSLVVSIVPELLCYPFQFRSLGKSLDLLTFILLCVPGMGRGNTCPLWGLAFLSFFLFFFWWSTKKTQGLVLLGRCSTTWATLPGLFLYWIFSTWGLMNYLSRSGFEPLFS
jgi:hypothetical protein